MSFFLHHLGHRQIAQFFAHPYQVIDDRFKLAHGLNLLAIERDQLGIGETQGNGLLSLLAREQRAIYPRTHFSAIRMYFIYYLVLFPWQIPRLLISGAATGIMAALCQAPLRHEM
jgi:hypothetical protein